MSSTKINLLLVGDKIKIQIIESLKHRNSSEKKQNTGAAEVEKSLKLCSSSEKKQNTGAAEEVKEQRDTSDFRRTNVFHSANPMISILIETPFLMFFISRFSCPRQSQ